MDLVETIAMRRSGHHAVMSWYIKNLIGQHPQWSYLITVQTGTKSIFWNDGGYNEDEIKLFKDLNFTPEQIFINYEHKKSNFSFFSKNNIYRGPYSLNKYQDINFENSKRILIIRDFYNNLCSIIKLKREIPINPDKFKFIDLWKDHARSVLNEEIHFIKYEDWLTCQNCRKDFLYNVFGIKEIFNTNGIRGTNSSFSDKTSVEQYLNRFDPTIIHEKIKEMIRQDNELHYLIGALGYEYKSV